MKQQDIALIIVIAVISGVISFFLSGVFFSGGGENQTVSKIDAITPEFEEPSDKYFNANAVNPTPYVEVGDSNNDNPFNGN